VSDEQVNAWLVAIAIIAVCILAVGLGLSL
jgi:hypothetical protein